MNQKDQSPFDDEFNYCTYDDSDIQDFEEPLYNGAIMLNSSFLSSQTEALQTAMENFASTLNKSATTASGSIVATPSAQYKGFIAEEFFKETLKINALAEGVPDWQLGIYTKGKLPDGTVLSGIDMETDISVWKRDHIWDKPVNVENYQSKIHNDAAAYAKDIRNAQYKNVNFVGGAKQGVNDKISVEINGKRIYSDNLSPQEAYNLSEQAKNQNVSDYSKQVEKMSELHNTNLQNSIKVGAATGAFFSAVKEIIHVIKNRDDLPEDQFILSVQHILCGTVEGAFRSGAIYESVILFGQLIGKELTTHSFQAVPAMAAANVAVSFAKDLYKCFITEDIDTDDLLCNTVNNAFTSLMGFGGSALGATIGGSIAASISTSAAVGASIGTAAGPVGTAIGAAVGGIVFGLLAGVIVGVANKDATAAFAETLNDINSKLELNGVEKLYYFADSMSSLSEFRLSFKQFLPCYNLISDLKEYNLHKKAINEIRYQMNNNLIALDNQKTKALKEIENKHLSRMNALDQWFKEQDRNMFCDTKKNLDLYIQNSYANYMGIYDLISGNVKEMLNELDNNIEQCNSILSYQRNRNNVNLELNTLFRELTADGSARDSVKFLVNRIMNYMKKDELLTNRQYISHSEANYLVKGVC